MPFDPRKLGLFADHRQVRVRVVLGVIVVFVLLVHADAQLLQVDFGDGKLVVGFLEFLLLANDDGRALSPLIPVLALEDLVHATSHLVFNDLVPYRVHIVSIRSENEVTLPQALVLRRSVAAFSGFVSRVLLLFGLTYTLEGRKLVPLVEDVDELVLLWREALRM